MYQLTTTMRRCESQPGEDSKSAVPTNNMFCRSASRPKINQSIDRMSVCPDFVIVAVMQQCDYR